MMQPQRDEPARVPYPHRHHSKKCASARAEAQERRAEWEETPRRRRRVQGFDCLIGKRLGLAAAKPCRAIFSAIKN